jgi:2-alkenal reductase
MPRSRVPLAAIIVAAALGAIVTLLVVFAFGGFDSGKTARAAITPGAEQLAKLTAGAGGRSWSALYAAHINGVVTVFVDVGHGDVESSGSGFVANASRGLIITNSHVVTTSDVAKDPRKVLVYGPIYVQRADGARAPANIVGYDLFDDIAILHYDPSRLPMPEVPMGNSATVHVGDPVAAIGAPWGHAESLSAGIVSQIGTQIIAPASVCFRTIDGIQTDASINPGNSGGPLFDAAGEVVGVNSQIEEGDSGSDAGTGVAFAVPINAARRSLNEISANGHVRYAWLGVGAITLTSDIRSTLGIRPASGAQVTFVDPRSAAAQAGITPGLRTVPIEGRVVHADGDVITALDGKPVKTVTDLQHDVAAKRPGDHVTVAWWHGKTERHASIVLGERSPTDPEVCRATTVP